MGLLLIHYIYLYIYIYIYIYIFDYHIYIYIYIRNHEKNVPSWLSPQWVCGNSCTFHMMYGYTLLIPMNQRVLTYIMLLAWLVEHSLVHWYQKCVTVHHVPKCISCHKAIVVITGRAHCFHDCIYITSNLLLRDLSTLCVVNHL